MISHDRDCIICGAELEYLAKSEKMTCNLCNREFDVLCRCKNGHYVCDDCHKTGFRSQLIPALLECREGDPQKIFDMVTALPGVHMHGPEHHVIVPCVLLTAFYNCGGDIELEEALREAVNRADSIPGGTCGFWGACGASVGAGIFLSIVIGAGPLSRAAWSLPQELVKNCLESNIAFGGPRCCKRTGRLAIEAAVNMTAERLGIVIPWTIPTCSQHERNRECLKAKCPYYPR